MSSIDEVLNSFASACEQNFEATFTDFRLGISISTPTGFSERHKQMAASECEIEICIFESFR